MTRKEFVKKYCIEVDWQSKAWREMGRLHKAELLTPYNYCAAIITNIDLARFSGMSVSGISKWKNGDYRDKFLYDAVLQKSIACMILELEK